MIRTVAAVALAILLLSASFPGVDRARASRTTALLDAEAAAFDRAVRSLLSDDATAGDVPGARRTVEIRIPAGGWTTAPVAYVAVRGTDGGSRRASVAYRLAGGSERIHRVAGVDLRTPGGPVVVSSPGRHRLRLGLRDDAGPVVVAHGPDSGEAALALSAHVGADAAHP